MYGLGLAVRSGYRSLDLLGTFIHASLGPTELLSDRNTRHIRGERRRLAACARVATVVASAYARVS